MGSFLHPDTTRIIAKRIVLTGHPIKIHKKTATIRYMFFNPGDHYLFLVYVLIFIGEQLADGHAPSKPL